MEVSNLYYADACNAHSMRTLRALLCHPVSSTLMLQRPHLPVSFLLLLFGATVAPRLVCGHRFSCSDRLNGMLFSHQSTESPARRPTGDHHDRGDHRCGFEMPNLEVMEEMNEARKLEAAGAERSVPTLPGCRPDFPDSHILTLERPPKPKPDPTLSLWLFNMLACLSSTLAFLHSPHLATFPVPHSDAVSTSGARSFTYSCWSTSVSITPLLVIIAVDAKRLKSRKLAPDPFLFLLAAACLSFDAKKSLRKFNPPGFVWVWYHVQSL